LEGIVAKQKSAPHVAEREQSTWFKILNREYPQKDGRENYLNVSDTVSLFRAGIRVRLLAQSWKKMPETASRLKPLANN